MASKKLNTIEEALLKQYGGEKIIVMVNHGTTDKTPDSDVLRFITPEGVFDTAEYFTEYGVIDTDQVVGNILEMKNYKEALQNLNDQYKKYLEGV